MSPASCRFLFFPLALVALAPACSPKFDNPPLDTRGNKSPGPAGGSAPSTGSDAAAGDDAGGAAPVDAGGDAQLCAAGGCNGCCDTLGLCQPGTTNAVCGVSGGFCLACPIPMNCTNGFCQ